MSGRPCNPGSDLRQLWRTLLGTPFPQCGVPETEQLQDVDLKAPAGEDFRKDGDAARRK